MDNSTSNIPEESFQDKIAVMMFGFGDSSKPNSETVKLVEDLVKKQIREMLYDITSNMINNNKNYKIITSEDIIFYFRKSKFKVQRLLKYAAFKKRSMRIFNGTSEMQGPNSYKLAENIKQFIEAIDETGELSDTATFDAVKHSRMLRAERISSALDDDKYLEYAKARTTNFIHKTNKQDGTKFIKWIDPQNEFHLRGGAIEIISFLAYGIVANVTDMALIIRENNSYQPSDPLKMTLGQYHNGMMFNVPHISKSNPINRGQKPITVDEMYEVIRRCYMPQVGYMKFSNKSILGKRKLCY